MGVELLRKVAFLFLIFILFVSLFFANTEKSALTVAANNNIWSGKVIIDAGHGGLTNTIKV